MHSQISIVIVNWNGERHIKKNLPLLINEIKKYPKKFISINVIDNASIDNSLTYLESINEINLIKNKINKGYGGAINKFISDSTSKFICTVGYDVRLEKNIFDSLLAHFNDDQVFAVGPGVIIKKNKFNQVPIKMSLSKSDMKLERIGRESIKYLNPTPIPYLHGGFCIYRMEMINLLNGFLDIYNPAYNEDMDICFRAWRRGWKSIYVPIIGAADSHESILDTNLINKDRLLFLQERNRFYFKCINIDDRLILVRYFYYKIINGSFRYIAWLFTAFFKIMKYRSTELNSVKLSTKEIIENSKMVTIN